MRRPVTLEGTFSEEALSSVLSNPVDANGSAFKKLFLCIAWLADRVGDVTTFVRRALRRRYRYPERPSLVTRSKSKHKQDKEKSMRVKGSSLSLFPISS